MVFDSQTYLVFFIVFFVLYHLAHRSFRSQNALALAGSCVFYGWWDVRFLALLFASAGIDYVAGLALGSERLSPRGRKQVLALSMVSNLAILFVFKYFDFFSGSLQAALASVGLHRQMPILGVVLPVGISFYSFQSMSYTIDVYRGQTEPERNLITYLAFVCFFPHMVAGPIQRAHHLIGQLNQPRVLTREHAHEATFLLIYGYFLKEMIANPAAVIADTAFTPAQPSGWATLLGTLAFAIQIYCDFWAYSMIARGSGRLLGIEFIWNFNQPYLATSIQEFWRRWHISLSTWLRDYLYIPLGGNRRGAVRTYVNLLLTMLLGGLWHGAAWNFASWGLLHGAALAVQRLYEERLGARRRPMPVVVGWGLTMTVVLAGWFLFRCRSLEMMQGMLGSLGSLVWTPGHTRTLASLLLLAAPVAAVEVWQQRRRDLLAPLALRPWAFALMGGTMLALTAAMFDRFNYVFIYFQF